MWSSGSRCATPILGPTAFLARWSDDSARGRSVRKDLASAKEGELIEHLGEVIAI